MITNMKTKELICIGCPVGCNLLVDIAEDGRMTVTGNDCINGDRYAQNELTDPRRIVTSTVRTDSTEDPVVSVKTIRDIPKSKITECMTSLKGIEVKVPIHIGDIVIADVAGTGVDIVATKEISIRVNN